jgi:hypothetical protein
MAGFCAVLAGAGVCEAQEAARSSASATAYELSKAELELDCRKLTGRMQVRILQVRDYAERAKSSAASRLAQQALAPIAGGSQHGADPDGQYRRDLAMLHAYNRRLAEKKCPTFDLESDLKPQPVQNTPRPVAPKQN